MPPKNDSTSLNVTRPEVRLRPVNGPLLNTPPDLALYELKLMAAHLQLVTGFEELLALDTLRFQPFDYQVRAARTALRRLRGRGLLADEVGLGKTIEAGLVLKEYMLRQMVTRVLILTPPSLVEQWQEELAVKFDLTDFVSSNHPDFRSLGTRAWNHFPRVIASLATARRAEHAAAERGGARIDAEAFHFVDDVQHVGGRADDHGGLEVADELGLALGLAAGDRHHGATQALGAVVRAQPAGEQAVTMRDMNDVRTAGASGTQRAGHDVGPVVDVIARVANDGRLAGRAARGVDADDVVERHREHAVRIGFAQVLLGGEGESGKVGQFAEIGGMHSGGIEFGPVMGDPGVGPGQGVLHARQLQRRDLVAAGGFDRFESGGSGGAHKVAATGRLPSAW